MYTINCPRRLPVRGLRCLSRHCHDPCHHDQASVEPRRRMATTLGCAAPASESHKGSGLSVMQGYDLGWHAMDK